MIIKKNLKIIKTAVIFSLCMAVILPFCSFEAKCAEIRDSVFRLHILANSDSEEDQKLKLCVRDALLDRAFLLFDGITDKQEAIRLASESIDVLRETAEDEIEKQGFDYTVSVTIGKSWFNTRAYGDETFPAGNYDSLIVAIGNGGGKNWWCVMFPPLCLSAAEKPVDISDVLSPSEQEIVSNGEKYRVKFWCVEKYEEIKEKIKSIF